MEKISKISVHPLSKKSPWIQLYQVKYTQNNIKKTWDVIHSHDSCAILIHNVSRDVFVFVRQFRPAVYMSCVRMYDDKCSIFDETKVPTECGFTLELCAGIIDKAKPVEEIAVAEILEECGYGIQTSELEKIIISRSNVGTNGSQQNLYYAAVNDSMKVGKGGGNPEEGELLETFEIPVKDSLDFALNSVEKPVGLAFALLWFHTIKCKCFNITMNTDLMYCINRTNLLTRMENIGGVCIELIDNSQWIKPFQMRYTQNCVEKRWDVIVSSDSCSILVHNTTRDVFVFVRQFRPAVYVSRARCLGESGPVIDGCKVPATLGFTVELCAGINEKGKSVEQTAIAEIREECGYQITADELEKMIVVRNSVGISGSRQTMFYARVTDAMKVGPGGGKLEEGEMIEVIEVPVRDGLAYALDDSEKPITTCFALVWYYYKQSTLNQYFQ